MECNPSQTLLSDSDVPTPPQSTQYHSSNRSSSSDGRPPPLPPRPSTLSLLDDGGAAPGTPRLNIPATQPSLQSRATTAISLTETTFDDGRKEGLPVRNLPATVRAKASLSHLGTPRRRSDAADSASIRSYTPHLESGDVDNIFSDLALSDLGVVQQDSTGLMQFPEFQADDMGDDLTIEFEPVGEIDGKEGNEGAASPVIWLLCSLLMKC